VSAVSHDHRRPLAAISRRTRPTQLRHTDLLPGAHQYVQDAAGRQEKVDVVFIRRVYNVKTKKWNIKIQ